MNEIVEFASLVGKTIVAIHIENCKVGLYCEDDEHFEIRPDGDASSGVCMGSADGAVCDILGCPILEVRSRQYDGVAFIYLGTIVGVMEFYWHGDSIVKEKNPLVLVRNPE